MIKADWFVKYIVEKLVDKIYSVGNIFKYVI